MPRIKGGRSTKPSGRYDKDDVMRPRHETDGEGGGRWQKISASRDYRKREERRGGTDAERKKTEKKTRQETLGYEDEEIKMK